MMDNIRIVDNSKRKIILIAHDVRSAHNVGSLLRTAEGLAIDHVYLSGYTPYPQAPNDKRLPHISERIGRQIHKTALGAEKTLAWNHIDSISMLIKKLRNQGVFILALEQTPNSKSLVKYKTTRDVALIVGSEVDGLERPVLELADIDLHIPMLGTKESFNVANAAAMALYHLRFQA